MKKELFAFLSTHYLHLRDILFYIFTLGIIIGSTYLALQVTQAQKVREQTLSVTRDIPVTEYTVKEKPIYVALQEVGLSAQEITQIVSKLSSVVDTRKLHPQDTYSLSLADGQFVLLILTQGFKHYYVAKVDESLVAGQSEDEINTRIKTAAGTVQSSLFGAMTKDGLQTPLILDFTDAFSWTIDFNTDTRTGDRYAALWEENYVKSGEITSQDLIAASYYSKLTGETVYSFYFDGEFYDETGKVTRKMFLKSPISFRNYRISSRFNPSRLHPILKIRRPHLGIDYAAPIGTPVQAVADGTVKFAGWKGGFGNFVEIKHANNYTTMYGHLKSYGKGIKAGAKVKQGQTVGYVGSSGLSTGPHLDFRIKEKEKFLDFLKMRNRSSAVKDIPKEQREEFEALKVLYLKELQAAQKIENTATPVTSDTENTDEKA